QKPQGRCPTKTPALRRGQRYRQAKPCDPAANPVICPSDAMITPCLEGAAAAGKPSGAKPPAFTRFAKRCCLEALFACRPKPSGDTGRRCCYAPGSVRCRLVPNANKRRKCNM